MDTATDVLTVLFRGDDISRERLEQDGIARIHTLLTPEILHFAAQNLVSRLEDENQRTLMQEIIAEIEKKHLVEVSV